jgi:hypothetical protein
MKTKKKAIIYLCLVLIFVISSIVIISASDQNPFTILGKMSKDYFTNTNSNGEKAIAYINNIPINESDVLLIKQSYEAFGKEITKEDIIKDLAIKILLMQKAEENGITVSDEAAEQHARMEIDKLKEDKAEYNNFINYINAAGFSEDEYINLAIIYYKKALILGKYKNDVIKQKFMDENRSLTGQELNNAFEKYYSNLGEELFANATLVIE